MTRDEQMIDKMLQVIEKYKPFSLGDIKEVYKRSGNSIDTVLLLIKVVKEHGIGGFINKLTDLVKEKKI